jgi:hypothetical protein
MIAFIGLAFTGLGLDVFLDNYYCRSRQDIPEPASGRVHRLIVCHGQAVYLSNGEYLTFEYILPATSIAFFISAVLLSVRAKG